MSMTENKQIIESFRWNERVATLVQHLIASIMLSLAVVSFVQVGERLLQDWQGNYLVVAAFIISMEAMLSFRYVVREKLDILSKEWVFYRLAEWVVILVFLKFWLYLNRGFEGFWDNISSWGDKFFLNFFSGEYMFASLGIFIIWVLASRFSEAFADLEGDEKLLTYERESGLSHERAAVRKKLVSMIFTLGGVMVVLTAVLRGDWDFLWRDLPQLRAGVFNILAYFVLGLVLLSLTQFSILRARWGLDQISIGRDLARRWIMYSFAFLLILVIVSAWLPTSYSLNLLNIFSYFANMLVFLSQAFIVLLLLLLAPILRLIAWLLGQPAPKGGQPDFPLLPSPPISGESPPWLELLKSILFWLLFLGAIGLAVGYYYRSHQDQLRFIKKLKLIKWLQAMWSWFTDAFSKVDRQVTDAFKGGIDRLRKRIGAPRLKREWDLVNLNRFSPKQRVLFFYLAMVRRGGETGVPRDPSQTPFEYSSTLIEELRSRQEKSHDKPDHGDAAAEKEILGLTSRFVEARYSQHEVTSKQADLVKRYWQRIRRTLRRWRRIR